MQSERHFSFIIPALNEEAHIGNSIRSITNAMGDTPHDIVLSDNGSTDKTVEIAQQLGAKAIVNREVSIAQLRNLGVAVAQGDLLVFIDSDVQLSEDWLTCLNTEMQNWPKDDMIVSGSTCLVPEGGSFVEQHWFSNLQHGDTSYINSGHLITTRALFTAIDGFNSQLRTAEDYDFCQRAKQAGAPLIKAPNVKSYHYGYPQTLRTFMRREAWHGREDFSSLGKFLASKTAMAACLNSSLLLIAFALFISGSLLLGLMALILVSGLASLLTVWKFGVKRPKSFAKTAFCFECYLLGRIGALFIGSGRPAARS